ncbi:hypothetical protein N752_13485 [Desulforamulus aquiferis]|nr:hypothetical protein N752_13485 [Desulforamulus aquiferis]
MVVVMLPQASEEQIAEVDAKLIAMGCRTQVIHGVKRTVVAAWATEGPLRPWDWRPCLEWKRWSPS